MKKKKERKRNIKNKRINYEEEKRKNNLKSETEKIKLDKNSDEN